MVDDIKDDPFKEYIRQVEPSNRELAYAWSTAIGLQAVDGLETSNYLKQLAKKNIEGKISLSDAGRLIQSYYSESPKEEDINCKEADIVSARISTILSEKAFTFSLPQYTAIHKRLFDGIYSHAGKIRDYNITKKEWVLDGASVSYGNALELKQLLEYDIQNEKEYEYSTKDVAAIIPHLAKFVSGLWQIHAFSEGNTRTTAVFFIKYLRSMGFDVTNDSFAAHSWYFRNSLVRANYNDFANNIRETTEFLELFLKNLLLKEKNELKNRYMHVRWKEVKQDIEREKQDIQVKKQDIEGKKQDIEISDDVGDKTKKHIQNLFSKFGYEKVFGRKDVIALLGLTPSPASELIKKMLKMELITPITGQGKGKYLFKRS